jgi:TnpA family transposase
VQIYTHISDQYSPFYAKVISRVQDSTHVLDGLLYHEYDLEVTEQAATVVAALSAPASLA